MLIAASSDIHSYERLKLFERKLKEIKKPDLFLLAGDITDKGDLEGVREVVNLLDKSYPTYACLGNEEYNEIHEDLLAMKDLTFLKDEVAELEIKGRKVAIIGTRGSLDKPTRWQKNNIPNIKKEYKERIDKIRKLLKETSDKYQILLMHYAPTYKTVKGEKRSRWPEMACKEFEKVIKEEKPEVVIHGHAHNGKEHVKIGATNIYNVALPLGGEIVEIDTEKLEKGDLTSY